MKHFVFWYEISKNEEDYTVITASDEDEAFRIFRARNYSRFTNMFEIKKDDARLAHLYGIA